MLDQGTGLSPTESEGTIRSESVRERIKSIIMSDRVLVGLHNAGDLEPVSKRLVLTAPDSQRAMPVFVSSITGTLTCIAWSARIFLHS